MKKLLIKAGITALVLGFTPGKTNAAPKYSPPANPSASSTTIPSLYGVGLATSARVTGSDTALSPVLMLGDPLIIQGYLSLDSTSPFIFGIGGILKYTMMGTAAAGLHLGGGIGLGTVVSATNPTTNSFFFSALGNIGLHFKIGSDDKILVSFDSGPGIAIANDTTNFTMGAYSNLLGASIHYLF